MEGTLRIKDVNGKISYQKTLKLRKISSQTTQRRLIKKKENLTRGKENFKRKKRILQIC